MGKVEKAGGLWKEVFEKTVLDMQLQGIQDVILATSIVTQTRNSFARSSSYSPNSWVLGKPEIRLLIHQEAERLEVLEAVEDPQSAMARSLGIREAARVAQVRLDTDSRVRGVLSFARAHPRGPYPVGSYVYIYRRRRRQDLLGRTAGMAQQGSLASSCGTPPGWPTTCLLAALFCDLRG